MSAVGSVCDGYAPKLTASAEAESARKELRSQRPADGRSPICLSGSERIVEAGGAMEAGEADSELMQKIEYPVVWDIAMVIFLDLEQGFISRRVKYQSTRFAALSQRFIEWLSFSIWNLRGHGGSDSQSHPTNELLKV